MLLTCLSRVTAMATKGGSLPSSSNYMISAVGEVILGYNIYIQHPSCVHFSLLNAAIETYKIIREDEVTQLSIKYSFPYMLHLVCFKILPLIFLFHSRRAAVTLAAVVTLHYYYYLYCGNRPQSTLCWVLYKHRKT